MLINALEFWGFLAVFIIPYYAASRMGSRWQNGWLLLASAAFYCYAGWQFMALLIVVTAAFFTAGLLMRRRDSKPRRWLTATAVIGAVALLFVFKYLDFAIGTVVGMLRLLRLNIDTVTVHLIAPIGISYYTFKLISYVVDVSNGKIQAEHSFVRFATYIMFFPTIMSGPIDRYSDFGPQLASPRLLNSDNLAEGSRRVLWGMMLKMCIADRIAPYTDAVFNNVSNHNGITIVVASMLYLVQMYSDFAGYSSMAIGVGRMMGFTVAENFERPLMSLEAGTFWRRWHMSLSYWLRDYVYIPLGGSRCSKWRSYLNVMVTFVLCGAWHGANWTYILFGAHHGLLVIAARVTKGGWRRLEGTMAGHHTLFVCLRRVWLFLLCSIGAMYFRSNSITDIAIALQQIAVCHGSLYTHGTTAMFSVGLLAIILLFWKEYNDESGNGRHFLHHSKRWVRVLTFSALIVFVLLTGQLSGGSFIYVQF